jgi:hypothetical protein
MVTSAHDTNPPATSGKETVIEVEGSIKAQVGSTQHVSLHAQTPAEKQALSPWTWYRHVFPAACFDPPAISGKQTIHRT